MKWGFLLAPGDKIGNRLNCVGREQDWASGEVKKTEHGGVHAEMSSFR